MKFLLTLFLCFSFLSPRYSKNETQFVNDTDLGLHTSNAILIEANSGKVLYEENADEKHYPASMTKMMGMYLVLKAIDEKKITFEDQVTCSSYASSMGGTQIFLEEGEQMSVKDLFKSVAINSANDAITALGEHLEGSTEAFVKKMNQTAKDLGMKNTVFKNPTGFDDKEHVTTPRDMATIAFHLVKYNELLFQFTRLKEAYVREDSSSPFWLVNTNKMLGHYEGMDGLKTGYTSLAKYNLTATAIRNGIRLISVVMNEESIACRSQDTTKLLNYGFSKLELIRLYPLHKQLCTHTFLKSLTKDTPIVTKNEVNLVVNKGTEIESLSAKIEMIKDSAPLKKDELVGYLVILDKQGNEYRFELIVLEDVNIMSFLDYFKEALLNFFA